MVLSVLFAAAGTQSSFWCPDIPHCSNLPSSAAPLHRAGPHNAQMVAIVLPRPLPHSVEQEALLCVPEGQEAWLTNAEPSEKQQKHTQGYFHVYTFLTFLSNDHFLLFCHILSFNTVQFTTHPLWMLCKALLVFIFSVADMILDFII